MIRLNFVTETDTFLCSKKDIIVYVKGPLRNWHIQEVLASYLSSGILSLMIFSLDPLYYSLVYPFLTYGLVVWGNAYATTIKPIVTLQKQALGIFTFSKQDAQSNPIFSQLRLIKFMDLVTMQTAIFMFQYYHNMLPTP